MEFINLASRRKQNIVVLSFPQDRNEWDTNCQGKLVR